MGLTRFQCVLFYTPSAVATLPPHGLEKRRIVHFRKSNIGLPRKRIFVNVFLVQFQRITIIQCTALSSSGIVSLLVVVSGIR